MSPSEAYQRSTLGTCSTRTDIFALREKNNNLSPSALVCMFSQLVPNTSPTVSSVRKVEMVSRLLRLMDSLEDQQTEAVEIRKPVRHTMDGVYKWAVLCPKIIKAT